MNNLDIKEIRKKLNLSQKDFGKMLGVSLRSVQNWESGDRNISETAKILLLYILKYEHSSDLHNLIIEKKPSVKEVVDYIYENLEEFRNDIAYKLFIETEVSDKIIEKLKTEILSKKRQ